jgi:hypothetical protein
MSPNIVDLTMSELLFSLTSDKASDLVACQSVFQVNNATPTAVFFHPLHVPLNRADLLESLSRWLQHGAHILRSDSRLARRENDSGQGFTGLNSGLIQAIGHALEDALCLLQGPLWEMRWPISSTLQVV